MSEEDMDSYETTSYIRLDESPSSFLSSIDSGKISIYQYSDLDIDKIWTSQFQINLQCQFDESLERGWEERKDILRYQVGDIKTKIVDDVFHYIVELNPNRITNRRPRQVMSSMKMQFDKNSFHFAQVPLQEVLFLVENKDWPYLSPENVDNERHNMRIGAHAVIVNASPISQNHCLLCPFVDKLLPQVLTEEALILALEIMMVTTNRDYRVAFNSLGAHASVNNLHFHIYELNHRLFIEDAPLVPLVKTIFIFKNYPANGFIFAMCYKDVSTYLKTVKNVMLLINYLETENIAYNIYITKGKPPHDPSYDCKNCVGHAIRIHVWARETILEEKDEIVTVASCELAGHFIGDEDLWNFADKCGFLSSAKFIQTQRVFINIVKDVRSLYKKGYIE